MIKVSFQLTSIKTEKLSKKQIFNICQLKQAYWKYNFNSQINWFNNNIRKNYLHNHLFLGNELIGYTCLRKCQFVFQNNKYNFLLFDKLCVHKDFVEQGYGKKIMEFNNYIIKKKYLPAFLFCESNLINFYKKYGWKKVEQKSRKNKFLMAFNTKPIIKNYLKKFLYNFIK